MSDKEKFLKVAAEYVGCNGQYVCCKKLKLGFVYDRVPYCLLYFPLEVYQRDDEKLHREYEREYKNADPDI